MRKGFYKVKTLPARERERFRLKDYPHFHISCSIKTMKNFHYGLEAKLVRCGRYVYDVTTAPEIYEAAH